MGFEASSRQSRTSMENEEADVQRFLEESAQRSILGTWCGVVAGKLVACVFMPIRFVRFQVRHR